VFLSVELNFRRRIYSGGSSTRQALSEHRVQKVQARFAFSIRATTSSGRFISRKEIDSFESIADFVKNSGILAELHAVLAGEQLDALLKFSENFALQFPEKTIRGNIETNGGTLTRFVLHAYEKKNSVISRHTTNCLS
jgi:hypothetical protein